MNTKTNELKAMPLSEAIDYFLNLQMGILSDGTIGCYRFDLSDFQTFLKEALGHDPNIAEINRDHIRSYRNHLLIRPRKTLGRKYLSNEPTPEAAERHRKNLLSRATVNRFIRSVARLFNFLVDEKIIHPEESPMLGVKNVSLPKPAPKAIEVDHCVSIIMAAMRRPLSELYKLRNAAIVALMGAEDQKTGLAAGAGELSRLRLADINGRFLHLLRLKQLPHEDDQPFIVEMTIEQNEALEKWLAARPPEYQTDFVFVTLDNRGGQGDGEKMRTRAVYSAWFYESKIEPEAWQRREEAIKEESYTAARRLAFILFLADTGCRLNGATGLTVDRLDLKSQQAFVIEKGRGGGVTRPVFFSETTAAALETWLKIRDGQKEGTAVFGVSDVAARRSIDNLATRLQIDAIHNPHSWRHAFAKITLLRGADLATVSQLMGHQSIRVTADFYARFNTRELAQAHKKFSPIDGLLEGM